MQKKPTKTLSPRWKFRISKQEAKEWTKNSFLSSNKITRKNLNNSNKRKTRKKDNCSNNTNYSKKNTMKWS